MQQFRHVQGHWDKLRLKSSKDVKLLEEIISKLRLFEVKWQDFFVTQLNCYRGLSSLYSCIQMMLTEKWNGSGAGQSLKAYNVFVEK